MFQTSCGQAPNAKTRSAAFVGRYVDKSYQGDIGELDLKSDGTMFYSSSAKGAFSGTYTVEDDVVTVSLQNGMAMRLKAEGDSLQKIVNGQPSGWRFNRVR